MSVSRNLKRFIRSGLAGGVTVTFFILSTTEVGVFGFGLISCTLIFGCSLADRFDLTTLGLVFFRATETFGSCFALIPDVPITRILYYSF